MEGHKGNQGSYGVSQNKGGRSSAKRRRSRAEQPELRFLNNEPNSLEPLCSFIFSISLSWPKRTYSKITYEQLEWGGEEERLSSTTVRSKQSACRFEKRRGAFQGQSDSSGTRYEPNFYHSAALVTQQGQHLHHRVLGIKGIVQALAYEKYPQIRQYCCFKTHYMRINSLCPSRSHKRSWIFHLLLNRSTLTTCSFHLKVACVQVTQDFSFQKAKQRAKP